jgi:glycosyltransferase involved in cell wall biosynthesis
MIFLRHPLNHIGVHSGYENFIEKLPAENICYKEVFRRRSLERFDLRRRFYITKENKNKAKRIGGFYNGLSYLAEMETLKAVKINNARIVHNTFIEDNHGYLGQEQEKYKFTLIGTAHQPTSWWKYSGKNIDHVKQLTLLLALSEHDKSYFEKFMPGRVRLVRHGVDTIFFRITKPIEERSCRILFVGNWLRDLNFFETVVSQILNASREILVDMVYSQSDLNNPIFKLCRFPQVTIHRSISNEQLLSLYNDSRLLFLPLVDSTANNSLLEASACGVPLITTGLPAIKEYTNKSFAYYYQGEKDCVEQIVENIKNNSVLKCRSEKARSFMESYFSSSITAKHHAAIYHEFL